MASIWDWSTTAADNGTADSGINFAEGQAPSTVNNSARQVMGRVAELLGDIGGALTAGGTANALTVTANSAYTAYEDGRILAFRATADNTGAATLNVNSIGAKAIRKMDSTGDVALAAGEIQDEGIYIAMYSAALNSAAGAWLLVNPTISAFIYALSGISAADGNFLVGNGTAFVAESGATARTSIGLGTADAVQFAGITGTTGTFSGALSATTGTFSGAVSGTTGTFSSTITGGGAFVTTAAALLMGPSASGNIQLRPAGIASSTGQVLIEPDGDVTINGTLTVTG